MDKIKLNQKETENLTRIKKDDINKLIYNSKFILDELYYDKQIAYMPDSSRSSLVNPVEDIYKLIEAIEFALDNSGNWDNNLDYYDMIELYDALTSLRQSLHNSISYARYNSQFKDRYTGWTEAYHKNMENSVFKRGKEKLENKIKKEAGWIPTYDNGKFEYSYFTDYHGHSISLKNIERFDEKQILSPEMVKERMDRGF